MALNPSAEFIRSDRWAKFRPSIKKRDGYKCVLCKGKSLPLTVAHIKSRKQFPELSFDKKNVVTICVLCNNKWGDKLEEIL